MLMDWIYTGNSIAEMNDTSVTQSPLQLPPVCWLKGQTGEKWRAFLKMQNQHLFRYLLRKIECQVIQPKKVPAWVS